MTGAKLSANRINGCRASCTRVWRDKIATAGYTAPVNTHEPTTKRNIDANILNYTKCCLFSDYSHEDMNRCQILKNNCVRKFIQENKSKREYVILSFSISFKNTQMAKLFVVVMRWSVTHNIIIKLNMIYGRNLDILHSNEEMSRIKRIHWWMGSRWKMSGARLARFSHPYGY